MLSSNADSTYWIQQLNKKLQVMESKKGVNPTTIDQYIAPFPKETQIILEQVRATIKKAAPKAEECISYGIPTFSLFGHLVHFAAFKNHIGFYATPSGGQEFKEELSKYKQGKGSIQFPIDEPMPLKLITKMVKFRVQENLTKASLKKSVRKG